jgi:hypothetical protein
MGWSDVFPRGILGKCTEGTLDVAREAAARKRREFFTKFTPAHRRSLAGHLSRSHPDAVHNLPDVLSINNHNQRHLAFGGPMCEVICHSMTIEGDKSGAVREGKSVQKAVMLYPRRGRVPITQQLPAFRPKRPTNY